MAEGRLFDLLTHWVDKQPDSPFLSAKYSDSRDWRTLTFREVYDRSLRCAQFLRSLGLEKGDMIGIIAENCPEWNILDLGAMQIGIVDVPMYPNISDRDYTYIIRDAGIKYLFVGSQLIYDKVEKLVDQIDCLKGIYTFVPIDGALGFAHALNQQDDQNNETIVDISRTIEPSELVTLIYTSGTTGNPKGVMLSHDNIYSNVMSVKSVISFMENRKCLSFLPLCHSFERMVFYAYLSFGMHIYYAESLDTIGENLKEVKPYCFTTVPRLLEKVYDKIMAKGSALTGIKKMLFNWAMEVGGNYQIGLPQGAIYNLKLKIARKLVFSKWKEALGGEVAFIVTGAAAMQERLITLFTAAGINVIEGYGLTETSPVLSVNRMAEEMRCIGTVGIPIPDVDIKLAEDNEILARGRNIMMGYYNRQDLTDEVIDPDGWFHTGDLGMWVHHNGHKFLKITDRKKELFKTAGGKYVAPQPLENKCKESPYIEQILIVGGDDKKFVSALIVPSRGQLMAFANHEGLQFDNFDALLHHPKVKSLIHKEIERANKHFGRWEQVKTFELVPDEWTPESGELTPTMKPKRKVLYSRYNDIIEKMYAGV